MKTLASVSSLLSVLACAGFLLTAAPASAQTSKPAPAATEADSDGDELPDATDPHPYIAEPPLTWRVGPMKIGWKADDRMIETTTTLSQEEKSMLKQKEYNFRREVGGSVDLSTEVSAALSLNPLKLLKSGAEVGFRSRISASGGFAWNNSEQEQASTLQRIVTQEQVSKLLSDMHIEFTVLFSNYGAEDYSCRALHIPLKIGDDVATSAQSLGANSQPIDDFRIPANRDKPLPILFRAYLDTQETRKLLQQVQSGTLAISLAESPGSIKSESGKDAIAAPAAIRRKTCEITIEVDGSEYSYCIARHDEKSGRALTLGEAFTALNDLSPPGKAKLFHLIGKSLRSAFGQNNEMIPPRWWVVSADAAPEQDVDIELSLPSRLHLRRCEGFPADMRRRLQHAEASDPTACLIAAKLYYTGSGGVAKDVVRAKKLLDQAADLKNPGALTMRGVALMRGIGGYAMDEQRAVAQFQQAEQLGDVHATTCLALARKDGLGGLKTDEKLALELFQLAADRGDMRALACLAIVFLESGPEHNLKKVTQMLQTAAINGDVMAMTFLGKIHSTSSVNTNIFNPITLAALAANAVNDAVNEQQALIWLRRAVSLNDSLAMRLLANVIREGACGLERDETKAAELEKRAAEIERVEGKYDRRHSWRWMYQW